jgi:type II secretion system protein N
MNRQATYAAGSAWFSFVFSVVFYYTFPSEAVAQRLAYEVDQATAGTTKIELSEVGPWWFGLSGRNLVVSRVDPLRPGDPPVPSYFAEGISVRVGVFSLLRRAPFVTTLLELEDATVEVQATTIVDEGRFKVRRVQGTLDDFTLQQLAQLVVGDASVSFEGSGTVDATFDLRMKEPNDLTQAGGEVAITSTDLSIDKVIAPSLGLTEQVVDFNVQEMDFRLRGEDGTLQVVRAALRSNMIDVDAEGDVTLGDIPGRSRLRLDVEVGLSEWSDPNLAMLRQGLEMSMRDAKWEDETYHYKVSAQLNRMSLSDLRPDRERTTRPTRYTPEAGAPGSEWERPPRPGLEDAPPIGDGTEAMRPGGVDRPPGAGLEGRPLARGEDGLDEEPIEEEPLDEGQEEDDVLDEEQGDLGELEEF